MKRVSSVLSTLALVAVVALARPARADTADEWCVGGVHVSDNVIQCVVDKTITVTPAADTPHDQTLGVVQSVRIRGTLSADLRKISEYMQGNRIDVPEQTLDVTLQTSGAPVSLAVTLAPSITVERRDGALVCTDVALNVSSIRGSFPDWLTRVVREQINRSRRLKDVVVRVLNRIFAHH